MRYPILRSASLKTEADRDQAGFTLTEMLVTMFIVVMASALLATGVPTAIEAYQDTVNVANAQVALSTTISAMRGELSLASDVRVTADGIKVFYLSENEGCWISLEQSSTRNGLDKTYYSGPRALPQGKDPDELVKDGTLVTTQTIPLISDASIPASPVNHAPLKVRVGEEGNGEDVKERENSFSVDPKNADVVQVNKLRVVIDASKKTLAKTEGTYRILARFQN